MMTAVGGVGQSLLQGPACRLRRGWLRLVAAADIYLWMLAADTYLRMAATDIYLESDHYYGSF